MVAPLGPKIFLNFLRFTRPSHTNFLASGQDIMSQLVEESLTFITNSSFLLRLPVTFVSERSPVLFGSQEIEKGRSQFFFRLLTIPIRQNLASSDEDIPSPVLSLPVGAEMCTSNIFLHPGSYPSSPSIITPFVPQRPGNQKISFADPFLLFTVVNGSESRFFSHHRLFPPHVRASFLMPHKLSLKLSNSLFW